MTILTRRHVIAALTLVVPLCGAPSAAQQPKPVKPTTVTLTIDGMTWEGCIEPVRSALLSVKGVTRAQVKLEEYEAIVTYDASRATVEDLIKAIGEAVGPFAKGQYTASVKKAKPPKSGGSS